jgi:hypothetical protein
MCRVSSATLRKRFVRPPNFRDAARPTRLRRASFY